MRTDRPFAAAARPAAARPAAARFAAAALLAAACAPAAPPAPPAPAGAAAGAREKLPPIPERHGALALDVVYPQEGAAIATRDSTFVFGSTGTGEATLTINGTPVEVQPNGAFLAFLPVPADSVYDVRASAAGTTRSLTIHVGVPPAPAPPPAGRAAIAPGSVRPRGAWAAQPGERVEVGFRGTPRGAASLRLPDGSIVPLVEETERARPSQANRDFAVAAPQAAAARRPAWSRYRGFFVATPLAARDTAVPWPSLATAPRPAPGDTALTATLRLAVAGDTVRRALPLNLVVLDGRPRAGAVALAGPRPRTAGKARAAHAPGGTWSYFWPEGTRFDVSGEREGDYRVALAPDLDAWISPSEGVRLLAPGTPPVHGEVGTVRLRPAARWVEVRLATSDRFPFRIEELEDALEITLYGAAANTGWLQYGTLDPWVLRASWSQPSAGVYRLRLDLATWPWGYDARWAADGDLVVRVRKPPLIDANAPLRGLTVAVDAGHPPGGAISPTRLTEAQANLAIAAKLAPLLERAGARVVMTRPDTQAVGLYDRTEKAEAEDADLLVSIHNNAFPDGVDPFTNAGTSVYYFHGNSAALAEALEAELLDELGLRNLGVGRSSLALVRNPTWMPAALTETMFMMVPLQGAALDDPDVQRRIAEAHLRGLEAFLRARARRK